MVNLLGVWVGFVFSEEAVTTKQHQKILCLFGYFLVVLGVPYMGFGPNGLGYEPIIGRSERK